MGFLICCGPKIKRGKKVAMPISVIDLHQLKDVLKDVNSTTMKYNSPSKPQWMGRVGLRPRDESLCGHTHIMKPGIAMGVSSEGGLTVEKILKMDSGKGCVWSQPMMTGGMVGERPDTAGDLGGARDSWLCVCVLSTVSLCSPPLRLAQSGSFKTTAVHWHLRFRNSLATLQNGCTLQGRCFEG